MSHGNNDEPKLTVRAAITIALLIPCALLLFVAVAFLVAGCGEHAQAHAVR